MIIYLSNLDDTKAFAGRLVKLVRFGDVITLSGTLGVGKSEFARAFIKSAVGEHTIVPSPTFTILEQYQAPDYVISHFDLYRLESPEELAEIGFDEAIASGVTLIEWPERLQGYPLSNHLAIEISVDSQTQMRTVNIRADESWAGRISSL